MFFKKQKAQTSDLKLSSMVTPRHKSGYVFVDINNDLGDAAEKIMLQGPLVKMAYGYARRCAALGMYAQGLINKDVLDHVQMIFKSLQLSTDQSKEFQEKAMDEAVVFMQSYHWQLTKLTFIGIRLLADEYASSGDGPVQDKQLLAAALDALYENQQSRQSSD